MVLGIVRLPFGVDPITEPEEVQHLSKGLPEKKSADSSRLLFFDTLELIRKKTVESSSAYS